MIVAILASFFVISLFCMTGDALENRVSLKFEFLSRVRNWQVRFLSFLIILNIVIYFTFFQSTRIARVIQNSNYYNIDPFLKKSLILMIQISNRPKTISALGFFVFNWRICSFVSLSNFKLFRDFKNFFKNFSVDCSENLLLFDHIEAFIETLTVKLATNS